MSLQLTINYLQTPKIGLEYNGETKVLSTYKSSQNFGLKFRTTPATGSGKCSSGKQSEGGKNETRKQNRQRSVRRIRPARQFGRRDPAQGRLCSSQARRQNLRPVRGLGEQVDLGCDRRRAH